MSRQRRAWVSGAVLVLLAGLSATPARAQEEGRVEGQILRNAQMAKELLRARGSRLRASAGPDPDTVYIAKSHTNHTAPDNYWNLYVGDYLPGVVNPNNAIWDWDNSVGIQAADSLHGWWPVRRQYNSTGGLVLADSDRPWWALDHGNIGNYVISQGAAAKRTFGVVGYWHSDPGKPAVGPSLGVFWTPLNGARSAWCGLRQHGDLTVVDQVTKNPYNQDVVQHLHDSGATGVANSNFPGYVDQADQMLYRDIPMSPGQGLTVTFNYRTRMSTSIGTVASTRTGWFHGDPLAVISGNFISSSAALTNAPRDSFMVYVGRPVNDAACTYSDGVLRPVYDKQRRWFSEVIRVFGAGNFYKQLFGATGNNPADSTGATPSSGALAVAPGDISTILGGVAGNVRLVFRCKTNRGFADSDTRLFGYTSRGRGAVQVDDVTIDTGGGPVVLGDFEGLEQSGVGSIDNRFDAQAPPGVTTVNNWRSTGKPPAEYFHVEALSGLTYNDLCGPPDSPGRYCNIGGLVVTGGNHDDGENAGDSRFTAFREFSHFIVSPTINLMPAGGGAANSMGISATIRNATDDYALFYNIYAGMFNTFFSGQTWISGHQLYPTQQENGAECWGGLRFPGFPIFNPEPQCFSDIAGMRDYSIGFQTSRAGGIPDSLRYFTGHSQQCFRFAITLGCNSNEGAYWDNLAAAFIDLPGLPGQASAGSAVTLGVVTTDIWMLTNDTFPWNETAGLPDNSAPNVPFDTTTALIKGGLNNAQATGNLLRFDIPNDTTVVAAANASVSAPDDPALATVRVDLVFRILPGPGNFQIAAGRSMSPGGVPVGTLLQLPTNQGAVAVSGDGSFWGQYIADPGLVSAGVHTGPNGWDPLTWNSARCDTAQFNIFPVGGASPTGTGLTQGNYMTMLHESDPKFTTLGFLKNKCFVVDTTKAATSSPAGQNVVCDGTIPAWLTTVPQSRTGFDGQAQTREFTKIIPDGLLTPGSHVQYFFRKSHSIDPFLNFAMMPDTNFITPQGREGNVDQHRWQQFAVLPDRWKFAGYGGAGSACLLYVDLNDRRGNEGRFVGLMDTLCGTAAVKRGAHNGWYAPGNVNIDNLDVRTNMAVAVSNRNSQPGTTWDMYQVKASESLTTGSAGALGSRLANRANMGFAAGKESRAGPTPEMLRTYYRMVAILSGDLNSGILGPFVNRSQDDISLLNDFLTAAGGTPQPRGIFVQGDGFGQSEKASGGVNPSHTLFLTDKLGVIFRNPSYIALSGNLNSCANLVTTTQLTPNGDVFGVANSCNWSNDVFQRNPALPETQEGGFYENAGLNGPYVSDVVKTAVPLRNWIAVTSGYEIEHLFDRYCDTTMGRRAYYYLMLNHVFASLCQVTGSPACALLETPSGGRGGPIVNFMKIGGSVMREGTSTVRLGIASAGRVQVHVYDVAGRKVRQLADRVFPAGEQELVWDGTDDGGRRVGRGVYFVRSSTQKDAGRIIVLNN